MKSWRAHALNELKGVLGELSRGTVETVFSSRDFFWRNRRHGSHARLKTRLQKNCNWKCDLLVASFFNFDRACWETVNYKTSIACTMPNHPYRTLHATVVFDMPHTIMTLQASYCEQTHPHSVRFTFSQVTELCKLLMRYSHSVICTTVHAEQYTE